MDFDLASIDHVLTTTRSVRKRLDLTRSVEEEIVMQCLDIALQAPTGSNAQGWKWLIVTDADKKQQVADYYRQSWDAYTTGGRVAGPGHIDNESQMSRVASSSSHLAQHLHQVPMMIFPCIQGRVETRNVFMQASIYGSILPAVWSLMLALRARGIGAAWTTLHLSYEQQCAELLGIPDDYTQAALLPVAYFTGETFQPAKRIPAKEITYWETWGSA